MEEGKNKRFPDHSGREKNDSINKRKSLHEKKTRSDTTAFSSGTSVAEESFENIVVVGKGFLSKSKSHESGYHLHECHSGTAISLKQDLIEDVPSEGTQPFLPPTTSNSSFTSAKSNVSGSDTLHKKIHNLEEKVSSQNSTIRNLKMQIDKHSNEAESDVKSTNVELDTSLDEYTFQLKVLEKKIIYKDKKIRGLKENLEECSKCRDSFANENKELKHKVNFLSRQVQSMYDVLRTKRWKSPGDPSDLEKYKSKISELEEVILKQEKENGELLIRTEEIGLLLQASEKELNSKIMELENYKNRSTLEMCKLINQIDCLNREKEKQSETVEEKLLEAQNSMDDEIVVITKKLEEQYQLDLKSAVEKVQSDFQKLSSLPDTAIEKLLQLVEPGGIDMVLIQKEWNCQQEALEEKIRLMQTDHCKEMTRLKDAYESKIIFLKTQIESLSGQLKERKEIIDIFEKELLTYKSNSSMNLLKASCTADDLTSLKELYTSELFSQKQVHQLEKSIFEEKVKRLTEEILYCAKNEEIRLQELENSKKLALTFREKYEKLVCEWEERVERDFKAMSKETVGKVELEGVLDEFKAIINSLKKTEEIHEDRVKELQAFHDDELNYYRKDIEILKTKLRQLETFHTAQSKLDETIQELVKNIGNNFSRTIEALSVSHATEMSLKQLEMYSVQEIHSNELKTLKTIQEKEMTEIKSKMNHLAMSKMIVEKELESLRNSCGFNEVKALRAKVEEITVTLLKYEGMMAVKEETEKALNDRISELENLLKVKEDNCRKELEDLMAKLIEIQALSSAKEDLAKELEEKINDSEVLLEKSCNQVDKLYEACNLLEKNVNRVSESYPMDGGDFSPDTKVIKTLSITQAKGENLKFQLLDTFHRLEFLEKTNATIFPVEKIPIKTKGCGCDEKIKKLEKKLEVTNEKMKSIQEERDNLIQQNDKLNANCNNLKDVLIENKKIIEKTKTENEALLKIKEEHRKLIIEREDLEVDRLQLLDTLHTMEFMQLEKQLEENEKILTQSEEFMERNKKLEEELNVAHEKLKSFEAERDKAVEQNEKLNNDCNNLKETLLEYKNMIEKIKDENDDLIKVKEELCNFKNERDVMKKQLEKLEAENLGREKMTEKTEDSERVERNKKLEEELTIAFEKIKLFNEERDKLLEQNEKFNKDYNNLKQIISEYEKVIAKMKAENEDLLKVKEELSKFMNERDILKKQLEDLQAEKFSHGEKLPKKKDNDLEKIEKMSEQTGDCELAEKNKLLEEELNIGYEKIILFNEESDKFLKQSEKFNKDYNNLKDIITEYEKVIEKMKTENDSLLKVKEELPKFVNERDVFKRQLEDLQAEKKQLILGKEIISAEKEELLEQNRILEANVKILNERVVELMNELANNAKMEKEEIYAVSLQEVRVLYEEETENCLDVERNPSDSTIEYQMEVLEEPDNYNYAEFNDLCRLNEKLRKENEELRMELKERSVEIQSIHSEQLDKLEMSEEDILTKLNNTQRELTEVICERNELLTAMEYLKRERDYLKSELESLRDETGEIRAYCGEKIKTLLEKQSLGEDGTIKETKMNEMKREIGKLSEYVKTLSIKLDVMKENNEKLLTESHDYLKHNQNLMTELEEAWTQRYEIEDQLTKVRRENALLNLHRNQLEETNKRISNLVTEGKPSVISWIKIRETVESIVDEVLALKTSISEAPSTSNPSGSDAAKTKSELQIMTESLHSQLQNKTILCDELLIQKKMLEKDLEGLEDLLRQNDSRIMNQRTFGYNLRSAELSVRRKHSDVLKQSSSYMFEKRSALETLHSASPEDTNLVTLNILKKHLESQVQLEESQFQESLKMEIEVLKEMQNLEESLKERCDSLGNTVKEEDRELELLKIKYEQEALELTKEFKEEVEKLRRIFTQGTDSENVNLLSQEARERYASEIENLRAYFEEKWTDLERRCQETYSIQSQEKLKSPLINERNEVFNQIQKIFQEEKKQEIAQKVEKLLEETVDKYMNEIKYLKQKYKEDLSNLESEHSIEIQKLHSKIFQIQQTLDMVLKEKEEDKIKEDQMEEAGKKHEAFLNYVKLEYDNKLLEERKKLCDLIEETKQNHEREMVALEEFWTEKLSECETRCAIIKATSEKDTETKKVEEEFKRSKRSSLLSYKTSEEAQDNVQKILTSENINKLGENFCSKETQTSCPRLEEERQSDNFCVSCLSNQVYFDRMEVKTDDDKLEIVRERDSLKEMVSSLRMIVTRLLSFVSNFNADLTNTSLKDLDFNDTLYKSIQMDHDSTIGLSAQPSQEMSLLEQIYKEGDRLQEEWNREKIDLQQQVVYDGTPSGGQIEGADKQLHSLKRFLEEQAAEREQEREAFDKEINNLKEQLKAKERDNSLHNRTVREGEETAVVVQGVEDLETQIKELSIRLNDVEKNKEGLESEFQNAVKKIWSLREVIQDLEVQLADVSERELNVKKKVDKLESLLEEECKVNRELKEALELCKTQGEDKYSERTKALEEELTNLRRLADQVNPETLAQMKMGLRDVELTLIKKTKDLEQLHVSSANVSCSSPSEDLSIRDHLDATRCSLPDEMWESDQPQSIVLPLEDLDRIQEKLLRHTRAEEVAMKYIQDLKMQLRSNRKTFEEVQTERDVLLERVDQYLKENSSLKVRLEEQRCNAGLVQKQLNADLESQISRLEIDVDKLNELCIQKDKQLQDMKEILENTTKSLKQRETEALNKSKEENTLISTLKASLANALDEKQKLEESMEKMHEKLKESLTMPALIETMIDEKNAEIDRLEQEVTRLSNEKSSQLTQSENELILPKMKKLRFSEPDSFGECVSPITVDSPSVMRNCSESHVDMKHSSFKFLQSFQGSSKLESLSSIGPLQLSPRGPDSYSAWKTSSVVAPEDLSDSQQKPSKKIDKKLEKLMEESKLQSEIDSKQMEISELKLEVDKLKRQLVEAKQELEVVKAQTKEIQHELFSKNEEIRQLTNSESSLQMTIDSLKKTHMEEVEEWQDKLNFERGKVEKVYGEIKILEMKKIEIEEAFLSLREDYNEKLTAEQKLVETLLEQIKDLELKNNELNDSLKHAREVVEKTKKDSSEVSLNLSKEISNLKNENESLKNVISLVKSSSKNVADVEIQVDNLEGNLEVPKISDESFKESLDMLKEEYEKMAEVISDGEFNKNEAFSYATAVKNLLSCVLNNVSELFQELENHRKKVMECSIDDLAVKVQKELVLSAKLDNKLLSSIEANGFMSNEQQNANETFPNEVGGGDGAQVSTKQTTEGSEGMSKMIGMYKELVKKITKLENEKEYLEEKVKEQQKVIKLLEETVSKEKERKLEEKERCCEDAKIMELLRVNLEKSLKEIGLKDRDLKKEKQQRLSLEKELEELKKQKVTEIINKKVADLSCQLEAQKRKIISLGRAVEEEKRKNQDLTLSLEQSRIERMSEKGNHKILESELSLIRDHKENLKTELINARKLLNARNLEIGLLKRKINLQEIDIRALSLSNDFNEQNGSEQNGSAVAVKGESLDGVARLSKDITVNSSSGSANSIIEKMKKLNSCVQHHVQESSEMGQILLNLSHEAEEMRELIKQMEENAEANPDQTLVADLEVEKKLWALERGRLMMDVDTVRGEYETLKRDSLELYKNNKVLKMENSKLKKEIKDLKREVSNQIENGALQDKVSRFIGEYMRAESYRKALAWQKQYLLISLSGYEDSEEEAWKKFGKCRKRDNKGKGKKIKRFRIVALAVLAVFRMRFVMRRWQRNKMTNFYAILCSRSQLDNPVEEIFNIHKEPVNPLAYQTQNICRRPSSRVLRTPPTQDPGLQTCPVDSRTVSQCLDTYK